MNRDIKNKIEDITGYKFVNLASAKTFNIIKMLKGLGLKKNDKVLVSTLTDIVTLDTLKLYGIKLYFVDIDINTLHIDQFALLKALEDVQRPKALIYTYFDENEDIEEVFKICKELNIYLVEDIKHMNRKKHLGDIILYEVKNYNKEVFCFSVTDNIDINYKIQKYMKVENVDDIINKNLLSYLFNLDFYNSKRQDIKNIYNREFTLDENDFILNDNFLNVIVLKVPPELKANIFEALKNNNLTSYINIMNLEHLKDIKNIYTQFTYDNKITITEIMLSEYLFLNSDVNLSYNKQIEIIELITRLV